MLSLALAQRGKFAPAMTSHRSDAAASALSSHLSAEGDVRMVDIAAKQPTHRRAIAAARVRMAPETIERVSSGEAHKGDVLAAARIAGIMAAKKTSELIPLCHGVTVTHVAVHIELDVPASCANVTAVAEAFDRTGVEMEAMVAASIASLTLYDMLKGIDREMTIAEVKLIEKSGGRSGHFRRGEAQR
jgi:cyclic pyranopterin monophosphate synthase